MLAVTANWVKKVYLEYQSRVLLKLHWHCMNDFLFLRLLFGTNMACVNCYRPSNSLKTIEGKSQGNIYQVVLILIGHIRWVVLKCVLVYSKNDYLHFLQIILPLNIDPQIALWSLWPWKLGSIHGNSWQVIEPMYFSSGVNYTWKALINSESFPLFLIALVLEGISPSVRDHKLKWLHIVKCPCH